MRLLSFSITLLFLYSYPSYAAENQSFDPLDSGLRMLWGLGIVCAIIYVIYLIAKRYFSPLQQQKKSLINVLETRYIMPKKSILLIEVRGKEYLVGTGHDSISTIVPVQPSQFSSYLDKQEDEAVS